MARKIGKEIKSCTDVNHAFEQNLAKGSLGLYHLNDDLLFSYVQGQVVSLGAAKRFESNSSQKKFHVLMRTVTARDVNQTLRLFCSRAGAWKTTVSFFDHTYQVVLPC